VRYMHLSSHGWNALITCIICLCVCTCVCMGSAIMCLWFYICGYFQHHSNVSLLFRAYNLLTCTGKGNASIRSIEVPDSATGSSSIDSSKTWNVCNSGNILCCKVDKNEKFALFGGWVFYDLHDVETFKLWRMHMTIERFK